MSDVKIQDNRFILASGREVWVSRLWMEHTYENVLEGTPETASQHIRRSLPERMRKRFEQKVVVIESSEKVLPTQTWIIKFESGEGAKTDDSDYNSTLFVCWFAEEIPDNLNEKIRNVLSLVNWEEQAEDYDITFI